jgi:hypothetical protein
MITERTLKQWRRDALRIPDSQEVVQTATVLELCKRILRLTQELMDLYLVKKG